jgi:hypothetical protein
MATKKIKAAYRVDQSIEEERERVQGQMEQLVQASVCANCRHLGDCAFLSKACSPILHCEIYECGASDKPRLAVVRKACAPVEAPEIEDTLLGLCVTCENLRSCNLRKPASGVWMCEEYC